MEKQRSQRKILIHPVGEPLFLIYPFVFSVFFSVSSVSSVSNAFSWFNMKYSLHSLSSRWLTAVSLLLVIAAGVSAAGWTWKIRSLFVVSALPDSVGDIPNEQVFAPGVSSARSIVNSHLFGQAGGLTASLSSFGPQLKLFGTFSGSRKTPEYALIGIDGGRALPFSKGAEVVPGMRVEAVAIDHVLIIRAGVTERLNLPSRTDLPRS